MNERAMSGSAFFAHRYQHRAHVVLGSTSGEHVLVQNTAARAAAHNGSNVGLEPPWMRLREDTVMTPQYDDDTELTLAEAASLCGCSTRTLTRDNENASVALSFIKRDGHNFVRVGDLIAAKRYVRGAQPASHRKEVAEIAEINAGLERQLGEAKAQCMLWKQRFDDSQSQITFLRALLLDQKSSKAA